jgi:hypothetical protein
MLVLHGLEGLLLALSSKAGVALAQQCQKEAAPHKPFGNNAEKQGEIITF